MKHFLLFFLVGTISAFSQIIEIKEDGYDKEIHSIVDINSDLDIILNADSLAVKISNKKDGNKELIKQIETLNSLLTAETEILNLLKKETASLSKDERIKILGEFSDQWSKLSDGLIAYGFEEKVNEYYNVFEYELNDFRKTTYNGEPYRYILESLNKELDANIDELVDEIDQDKYSIQMVAYLDTKAAKNIKVHIDNFDDFKEGEFYEVSRLVTSFSEEDVAAFERSGELAGTLNDALDGNLNFFKDFFIENFQSIDCIKASISEIKNLYDKRETLFNSHIIVATTHLKKLEKEYEDLLLITERINQFNEGKLDTGVLELFNQLSEEFVNKALVFPGEIESRINVFIADLGDASTPINDLKTKLSSCANKIKEDKEHIERIISFTKNFFSAIKRTADLGENIGKEVYSYGIKDLPKKGFIELKKTGKRDNGDTLKILLILKKDDDKNNNRRSEIIEKQILTLQQLKFYSVSSIGVIFANPLNDSDQVALENNFQVAPSGSLLFKFGSRTSRVWNAISPGLGFNVATPDFDLDGTPEIGVGVVGTLLDDIVSIGISYNTRTDNPYWFFGLSLPFSTLGLPINTIKTAKN